MATGLDPADVRRVTQVNVTPADTAALDSAPPAAPAVTHLLRGHVAYGLSHATFKQHIDPRRGAMLNGQANAGAPLQPGDQVEIGNVTDTAIRIE